MNSKFKTLFRNTIIFAIGNIGSKVILFFFLPLYTNVLTTSEYGITELVAVCSSLIVPIISLSIANAVLRFGLDSKEDKGALIKNAFLIIFVGSLLMSVFLPLLLLYEPISKYIAFIGVISFLNAMRSSLQYYAKATNRNGIFVSDSLFNTIILAVSNVVFLIPLAMGVYGFFWAQVISLIFSVVFLFFFTGAFKEIFVSKINKNLLKRMIVFSIPMVFNAISWWLLHSTDKIMIQLMMSNSDVGIYSVAAKMPTLVNT